VKPVTFLGTMLDSDVTFFGTMLDSNVTFFLDYAGQRDLTACRMVVLHTSTNSMFRGQRTPQGRDVHMVQNIRCCNLQQCSQLCAPTSVQVADKRLRLALPYISVYR
jgi:hypothetical protein